MKLAMLFLFLSSYTVGQEMDRKHIYYTSDGQSAVVYDSAHGQWITVPLPLKPVSKPLTLESVLSHWQEYSDSCAVDSTRHDRIEELFELTQMLGHNDEKITELMFAVLTDVPRFYWRPSTPDFPGFVEFLKRRKR